MPCRKIIGPLYNDRVSPTFWIEEAHCAKFVMSYNFEACRKWMCMHIIL